MVMGYSQTTINPLRMIEARTMITLHHLEQSRSMRIIWALEELGIDYQIKYYKDFIYNFLYTSFLSDSK